MQNSKPNLHRTSCFPSAPKWIIFTFLSVFLFVDFDLQCAHLIAKEKCMKHYNVSLFCYTFINSSTMHSLCLLIRLLFFSSRLLMGQWKVEPIVMEIFDNLMIKVKQLCIHKFTKLIFSLFNLNMDFLFCVCKCESLIVFAEICNFKAILSYWH